MVQWAGFRQTAIPVKHSESARESGKSSYNWSRKFRLALDIILSNSDKPMRLTIKLGFSITVMSLIVSFINFLLWMMGKVNVSGYTSLILSIWLLSGIIIFILGVTGLYVGKIFEEVKERPYFIIKEVVN
jgi:dolichol-phosphate mannosyltransferase